jgi:hypothetical protein
MEFIEERRDSKLGLKLRRYERSEVFGKICRKIQSHPAKRIYKLNSLIKLDLLSFGDDI